MAEKFDMKLELSKNFHEFFHENLESQKSLMYRMQALEVNTIFQNALFCIVFKSLRSSGMKTADIN